MDEKWGEWTRIGENGREYGRMDENRGEWTRIGENGRE